MPKILKVTLEFEDRIATLEGEEAEKWQKHTNAVAMLALAHDMNPFDNDPVKWVTKPKET